MSEVISHDKDGWPIYAGSRVKMITVKPEFIGLVRTVTGLYAPKDPLVALALNLMTNGKDMLALEDGYSVIATDVRVIKDDDEPADEEFQRWLKGRLNATDKEPA